MTANGDGDAVRLEGVTKRFGDVVAVDELTLRVPRGCIYGFLGSNGAGKTTTLRMVVGIFRPDAGSVSVLGREGAADVHDRVGYLPEEKGLYRKMRVAEVVAYFGALKGMPLAAARRRAHELLERFGLGDWADKRCEALSKGMGQKAQILSTIVHDPALVILDEPFSGLDPVNTQVLRDLIVALKREGRTVLFSTHVMEQAEQICDAIVLIHKGKKLIDGPLAAVKAARGRAIRLDYDGDGARLGTLPGVARVNDAGKTAEIFLEEGADPQALLRALVERVAVRRFDLREPSLHEIFIRAVGGAGAAWAPGGADGADGAGAGEGAGDA